MKLSTKIGIGLALAGVVGGGVLLSRWIRRELAAADAAAAAARLEDRAVIADIRRSLRSMEVIQRSIDSLRAQKDSAVAVADSIRDARAARPALPAAATASDSASYWHQEAISAGREAQTLRDALKSLERADTALQGVADTARAKADTAADRLEGADTREEKAAARRGLAAFLAALPHPALYVRATYAPADSVDRRFQGAAGVELGTEGFALTAGMTTQKRIEFGGRLRFRIR